MSGSFGSLLRFGAFAALGYSKAAILAAISSILALFTDRLEASSRRLEASLCRYGSLGGLGSFLSASFADTDRLEAWFGGLASFLNRNVKLYEQLGNFHH